MAASLKASGTWAIVTADPTVTIPGTPAAGDRMFLWAMWKPYTVTATVTAPQAWTEVAEYADGTVAAGNGVGSVKVACYYRDWQSGDGNPVVNFSANAAPGLVVAQVWEKEAGDTWDTPTFVTGNIPAADPFTVTSSSTITIEDGAVVFGFTGFRDDLDTFTRNLSTALEDDGSPNVTWDGNAVRSPATYGNANSGNDVACDLVHRFVTTGAAGVNLTATGDPFGAETGAALWVHQGITASGGGDVTSTATWQQAAATWAAAGTEEIPSTAAFAQTASWAATASERFTSTATFAQGAASWAATATERFTGTAAFIQAAATWDAVGQERLAASAEWTQTAAWSAAGLVANPVTATAAFEQSAAWAATATERIPATATFAQAATWAAAASEEIPATATWAQTASWGAVGQSAENVTATATWVQAAASWQASQGNNVTGTATFEQAAAEWVAQATESIESDATFEQTAQWAAVGQLAYIASAQFQQSASWAAAMSVPGASELIIAPPGTRLLETLTHSSYVAPLRRSRAYVAPLRRGRVAVIEVK